MSKRKEILEDNEEGNNVPVEIKTGPPKRKKMKGELKEDDKEEKEDEEEKGSEKEEEEESEEEESEEEESEDEKCQWYTCSICMNIGPYCSQCGECGSDAGGYFTERKMKNMTEVNARMKTLRKEARLERINIERDIEGLSELEDISESESENEWEVNIN